MKMIMAQNLWSPVSYDPFHVVLPVPRGVLPSRPLSG
jgi:hypothetical protein